MKRRPVSKTQVTRVAKLPGKKVAPVVRQLPWILQQSRISSPSLVVEYQPPLQPKALLRRELHELYSQPAPGV